MLRRRRRVSARRNGRRSPIAFYVNQGLIRSCSLTALLDWIKLDLYFSLIWQVTCYSYCTFSHFTASHFRVVHTHKIKANTHTWLAGRRRRPCATCSRGSCWRFQAPLRHPARYCSASPPNQTSPSYGSLQRTTDLCNDMHEERSYILVPQMLKY